MFANPRGVGSSISGQSSLRPALFRATASAHPAAMAPFLHTSAANSAAIRLYRSLGFTLCNEMKVTVVQAV